MKKLMVAVAVAAIAVASQAATAKWGSGTLYVPGTQSTKAATSYGSTASFYSLTAAQYAALETAISDAGLEGADEISTYLYNTYKDKEPTKGPQNFMSGAATITDPGTYGKGDDVYGVLLYTTYDNTDKTGDLYYIGNMGQITFASDANITKGNMGTNLYGAGGAALSWQTVPEPTSGLLLLLGMAGLALKRKHA